MTVEQYRTRVDQFDVHSSGWFYLPKSRVWTPKVSLIDRDRPKLFARCSQFEWRKALARRGQRLMRHAERREMFALAHHIEPVVLPTPEMLARDRIANTTEAIQAYRERRMMSLEWCEIHDAKVWELIAASGWDGALPVDNTGKYWGDETIVIDGVEHAEIEGWPTPKAHDGYEIQEPNFSHFSGTSDENVDGYDDYGTTGRPVSETDPR